MELGALETPNHVSGCDKGTPEALRSFGTQLRETADDDNSLGTNH